MIHEKFAGKQIDRCERWRDALRNSDSLTPRSFSILGELNVEDLTTGFRGWIFIGSRVAGGWELGKSELTTPLPHDKIE
jgi:hypothetical protein